MRLSKLRRGVAGGLRRRMGIIVLSLVVVLAGAGTALAQNRTPRLLEGKKSLYERVLTRPGAVVVAQPAQAGGTPVPPLSQYYVYDRKTTDGREWVEIGAGSRGKTAGWIAADATLPWKQQMSLAFTNPAGRDRTLLFDKRETVEELLKAPDPAAAVAPIEKAVEFGARRSARRLDRACNLHRHRQAFLSAADPAG